MRIRILLASFLFASTLFGGCSLFGDDTEVRAVSVKAVEVERRSGLTVEFLLRGEWRNTCGSFSRVWANRDGQTYSITMYGQQPEEALCGQAVTPISGTWTVTVPHPGAYTFRFQRQNAPPLDTTLTFDAP